MGTWYPSGGGGGSSLAAPGVLVASSGGDYATVKAAIDAGETLIYISGTVTDAATITFPTFAEIRAAEGGATWQPQAAMTLASGRVLRLSGLAIPYSTASTFASQLGTVKLELCTVTASDAQLFLNNTPFEAIRVNWRPRDASGQMVRCTSGAAVTMRDCVLTGAGSSCQQALRFTTGRVDLAGLIIDGTWNTGGTNAISVTSPATGSRISRVVATVNAPALILTAPEIVDIRHAGAPLTLDVTTVQGEARNIRGSGATTITGAAVIHGLYSSADMTIPAGCRIFGGELTGDITYSGAGALIEGVDHATGDCVVSAAVRFRGGSFDHSGSGSLTLSSGAPRLEGMDLDDANITNNDPGALITGSTDVSDDTDPTTRRFGHATLDAFRDRCLAYYPGTSSPQRNLAPVLGQDRAGPLLPQTAGATIVGGKFNIAGTTDRFTGGWCLRPYGIWAEFTVSFKVTPTTGNTGTQRNMFRIGPNVVSLNNESGRVRLYINGGNVVFPASVVFADATEALVQATRKEGTAYVYIDGVEVGSGANTALFNNWDEVTVGWNSGTGVIGTYSDVYIFDRALSLAELALLDANPLQGADI